MILGPECAYGKHDACNEDAWDDALDAPVDCECDCHKGEL